MRLPIVVALLVAGVAFVPGVARAGYGVQPSGQTIAVQTDSGGYISTPQSIGVLVYLDSADSLPEAWVSDSPTITSYGTPAGNSAGVCTSFSPWTEANKYSCSVGTILMKPNTTYYWWLNFYKTDPGNLFPTEHTSGPFSFTLALQASAPPASTPPASTPPTSTPPTSVVPTSTATEDTVTSLPLSNRFSGASSISDPTISTLVTKSVRLVFHGARALSAACWDSTDFDSVLENSQGRPADDGSTVIEAFWSIYEPSWLHLGPDTCRHIQNLLDTRSASATNGYGLMTALHESMHATGVRNEAQANCYAVQLVPYAAGFAGYPTARALYLAKRNGRDRVVTENELDREPAES